MRIYLSPSDQYANPVAAPVGGSELDWARPAADQVAAALRTIPGVEVKVGADWTKGVDEYARRVDDSNAWGADLHVCFHTNAGQGGTMICTYPGADSRRLGAAILREVAPLTPSADPGLVDRDDLYELNGTGAVAVLIELDRHDTSDGALTIKRLVENGAYAAAVVRGICSYAGLQWHGTMAGDSSVMPTQEDEVTPQDKLDIAAAVWAAIPKTTPVAGVDANVYSAADLLFWANRKAWEISGQQEAMKQAVAAALADVAPGADVDVDALAASIVVKLGERAAR